MFFSLFFKLFTVLAHWGLETLEYRGAHAGRKVPAEWCCVEWKQQEGDDAVYDESPSGLFVGVP